jgi:hypothetical protein
MGGKEERVDGSAEVLGWDGDGGGVARPEVVLGDGDVVRLVVPEYGGVVMDASALSWIVKGYLDGRLGDEAGRC